MWCHTHECYSTQSDGSCSIDRIRESIYVVRDHGGSALLVGVEEADALCDLADAARGVTDVDESNDVEWCPVCDCATDNCYCPLSDVRSALDRLDGDAEGE